MTATVTIGTPAHYNVTFANAGTPTRPVPANTFVKLTSSDPTVLEVGIHKEETGTTFSFPLTGLKRGRVILTPEVTGGGGLAAPVQFDVLVVEGPTTPTEIVGTFGA